MDHDTGNTALIVAVVVAEVLVIAGLVGVLYWQRKQAKAAEAKILHGSLQGNLDQPVYRAVILITIGMSAGYAALLLLQHHLMDVMEPKGAHHPSSSGSGSWINDTLQVGPPRRHLKEDCLPDKSWEDRFKHAATFNYLGNLIFRLAHNYVFGCVSARKRVYIALLSMGSSMLIISVGIYLLKAHSLLWVYLAYFLGGVGWGTFETNLISCITPLGHDTKVWAITGIPIGFMTISVLGFWIRSPQPFGVLDCHGVAGYACEEAIQFPRYLYFYVIAALCIGAVTFATVVPDKAASQLPSQSAAFYQGKEEPLLAAKQIDPGGKETSLPAGLRAWRSWLPLIWVNCFALMVQCFWLSFFVGFPFYIYNGDHISLVRGVPTPHAAPIATAIAHTCMAYGCR
jgi:hypothetical protein